MNWCYVPTFFEFQLRDGNLYGSLIDVLNRGSIGVILAIGMTLVIATAGVDLSVGAVVAISGAVAALCLAEYEFGFTAAIATAMLAAAVAGWVNGVMVSWFKIEPIIATLVLMVSGRGIAKFIAGEKVVSLPGNDAAIAFQFLGTGHLAGLPVPIWIAVAVAIIAMVTVRRTSIGLLIESVGANPAASRASGINDARVKLLVYLVAGMCAGIAGLIDTANVSAADPSNAGMLTELDAIFAVLVGGTALTGGRFSLLGSIIGALLLQTLMTTLYSWGVPSDIAPVPKALVILAVCLLQSPTLSVWIKRRFGKPPSGATREGSK